MKKKTTLITGASSGIGKELAYVYAKNNYDLVLVDRCKENLKKIKQEIEEKSSIKVEIFFMDLSELESADKLYEEVEKKNIEIEILINNAGFGVYGDFINSGLEEDEGMILLNILTLTKLCKLIAKDMKERKRGNIVNVASTGAFHAVPGLAVYAATKAYILNFSEAIAFELKRYNIFVTTICPGPTKTKFADTAGMSENPFKNAPTAQELAEFIYKSVFIRRVCAIHGLKNNLLIFFLRFVPKKLIAAIAKKSLE